MEMSLKTGFAQIFSRYPKNLSCPKLGGGGGLGGCPYAYGSTDLNPRPSLISFWWLCHDPVKSVGIPDSRPKYLKGFVQIFWSKIQDFFQTFYQNISPNKILIV